MQREKDIVGSAYKQWRRKLRRNREPYFDTFAPRLQEPPGRNLLRVSSGLEG